MDDDYLLVIKCHPEESEFSKTSSIVTCTEEGCTRTFSSKGNMRQHLRKFHKKVNLDAKNDFIIRQYHCPVKECVYNDKNSFSTLKYLKQHYIKVHAEKKFVCEKCEKRFPTQHSKILHEQSCGLSFKCAECENQYSCYESLLTHGRRKKHHVGSKEGQHPWSVKKKNVLENNNEMARFRMILQGNVSVAANPAGQDKSVQTDVQIIGDVKPKTKRRATRETQTCLRKKTRKSAETQTSSASTSWQSSLQISDLQQEMNKICLETQSEGFEKPAEKETGLVMQSSDPNLGGLDSLNFIHSTGSSNTGMFETNSFSNCNTETQTDFMFENQLLSAETQTNHLIDLDMYSNMYTQTYDDFLLPDGYESLPTQSVLEMDVSDREMSNTQTQTEIEYLHLLEEINA